MLPPPRVFAFLTAPGCRSEKPDGNDAATRPESDAEKARSMASVAKGSNMPSSVSVRFTWKSIASGSETPARKSRHCMAYDANSEIIVLFSEIDWANQGRLIGDTWELLARKWSRSDSAINPTAHHRGAMVYDPVRGNCLLFGGQGRGQSGFGYSMLDDTWTYANGQWKQWKSLFGSRPSPRCGHALAFDESTGSRFFLAVLLQETNRWATPGFSMEKVGSRSTAIRRRYAAMLPSPTIQTSVAAFSRAALKTTTDDAVMATHGSSATTAGNALATPSKSTPVTIIPSPTTAPRNCWSCREACFAATRS